MRAREYIVHVTPYGEGEWQVHEEDTPNFVNTYSTRDEAEDHALDMCKAQGYGRVVLHAPDGSLEDEYVYERAEDTAALVD